MQTKAKAVVENFNFYLCLALCAIGQGAFKDISDALMSGKFQDAFKISNPNSFFGLESSTRKYKNGQVKQGDKFFLSSTLFVWLTDGWHLFNTFKIICNVLALTIALFLSMPIYKAALIALIYWVLRSGTHHVMFTYLYAIIEKFNNRKHSNS